MSAWLFSLLTAGAGTRPSFLLRLGYLLFCWRLVSRPGGVEKLQAVAPYVLAGLGETPTTPLVPRIPEMTADSCHTNGIA